MRIKKFFKVFKFPKFSTNLILYNFWRSGVKNPHDLLYIHTNTEINKKTNKLSDIFAFTTFIGLPIYLNDIERTVYLN